MKLFGSKKKIRLEIYYLHSQRSKKKRKKKDWICSYQAHIFKSYQHQKDKLATNVDFELSFLANEELPSHMTDKMSYIDHGYRSLSPPRREMTTMDVIIYLTKSLNIDIKTTFSFLEFNPFFFIRLTKVVFYCTIQ